MMKRTIVQAATCFAVVVFMATNALPVMAQIPQVTSPAPVPQPPPPPPPSMAVPQVPKMDAPPPQPSAPKADRRSFNQRIDDCLSDSTAMRLDSSERAAYSRACAN